MRKTIAVIDTFGFFFRSYFAMPPLKSKSGFPTGLLTGFLNFLSKLNKEHEADYVIFCLESKVKGFREDIYDEYKGNRPSAPEDFKAQLPIAIEWLEKLGLKTMSVDSFEADDIIASVCRIAKRDGVNVRIVSHDKDLYQLIDDESIIVWDPSKKTIVNEEGCIAKFGVHPSLFIDFQALIGDSVDNVPGVKGIGPKTAEKLINEYKTIENIYDNIENISGRTKELLESGKESAFMSKKLVTLRNDVLERIDYDSCVLREIDFMSIKDEMLSYDIRHLIRREMPISTGGQAQKEEPKKESGFTAVLLDSKEKIKAVLAKIPQDAVVAFDTETDSLDTKEANLVGFSFSFDSSCGYYAPIAHSYLGVGEQLDKESAKEAILELFGRKIVGHNLKFDLAVVQKFTGVSELNLHADTMLLAWLSNPDALVSLDSLAKKFFDHEMIKFKNTVKTGEDFSQVTLEDACLYSAEDAVYTLKLYELLYNKLKNNESAILKEFDEIEMPFLKLIMRMEQAGIKLDGAVLKELLEKTNNEINTVKREIYDMTGFEFNINSTKQLSDILYERLGLKAGKKTKTGLSTDERTLQKMAGEHPVIDKILDYREIFKLKSTYIEPLLELATKDKNSKVYTSFLQTGTATGRLSSRNPNLQNIPTKTDVGRQIRYAFVADEGKTLIGLDYSQIELRLLAHFSMDETLTNAFLQNRDIHLETSQKIFGAEKAKENRSKAKTINFGLLYGMGSQKLSDSLSISVKEAKELIDSYFASFPTVKSFLESIKESAKETGFVQTLMGRKRFFEFKNANPRDEAMYLREAVNTVFQGTAADIIKLAMLKIDAKIKNDNMQAVMILQIHDELIFEVSSDKAEAYAKEFAEIMESIVQLNVPLQTSVNYGKNWGELK